MAIFECKNKLGKNKAFHLCRKPIIELGGSRMLFTFDLLIFFVPASKLLAFDGGYVGVVGTIYNGGNHTLKEKREVHVSENNQRKSAL